PRRGPRTRDSSGRHTAPCGGERGHGFGRSRSWSPPACCRAAHGRTLCLVPPRLRRDIARVAHTRDDERNPGTIPTVPHGVGHDAMPQAAVPYQTTAGSGFPAARMARRTGNTANNTNPTTKNTTRAMIAYRNEPVT